MPETTELKTSMAEVAHEMFGDKFVGEVPEKKPAEKAAAEEPAEKPAEETGDPAEEPVEIEEDAPKPVETEASEEETPEPEETEEPSGEVDISTLSELVEHYELDADWAKTLKVPVKINGIDSSVPIDDLVASFQIGGAADARIEDAKTEANTILEDVNGKFQEVNDQAKTVAGLLTRARGLFDRDNADIDWKHLRQNDPAEYSAKKADMDDRLREIESLEADSNAAYQKVIGEQDEKRAVQKANMIRAEQAALFEKIPEWSDPEKAKAEQAKISEYLIGEGFSKSDIANAADHKIIIMVRKAMLYDKGQGKANAAKKKVSKIPKIMKPGAPKPEDQRKTENIDRLKAKLRKSGSMADGLALVKAKRRA